MGPASCTRSTFYACWSITGRELAADRPSDTLRVLLFRSRSVAERAYCPLKVAAVDDARHTPRTVGIHGAPDDAQLADS